MGESAEMMLDGTLCQCCGAYIGTEDGYPVYCPACQPKRVRVEPPKPKVRCTVCGKKVKGLADHMRDAHGMEGGAA